VRSRTFLAILNSGLSPATECSARFSIHARGASPNPEAPGVPEAAALGPGALGEDVIRDCSSDPGILHYRSMLSIPY
jgi:hypothetical protein